MLTLTRLSQHYIIGAWYKPEEIGRRAAILSISGQAATLFSGPLQSTSRRLVHKPLLRTSIAKLTAAIACRRRAISRLERQTWTGRLAVALYRLRCDQCVRLLSSLFPRLRPLLTRAAPLRIQRSLFVWPAFSSCPTLRPRRRLVSSRLKNEPTPRRASALIRSRASLIGPCSVESLRGGTSMCSRSFGECSLPRTATRMFTTTES